MEIQAISLDKILPTEIPNATQVASGQNTNNFSNLMLGSINNLNQSLVDSSKAIENLALGNIESTHEVIIAMEESKMSLQIAVEVRNKLVEAYHEITRMQI